MSIRNKTIRIMAILAAVVPGHVAAQWGPANVVTETASLRMLAPSVDLPGTVISRHDSRLASELDAKLVWIAEVGTEVKKGETVAKLEDFTFKVREMEAQSRVEREQANVAFLESELKRLERLADQNLSAKRQLDETKSNLAIANSDLRIAEAQLGYAKIAMHVTEIRAPFDGIVTERLRSVGEHTNASDEVVRLVDPRALEVVARAPLRTANFIAKGDLLLVRNDYRSDTMSIRTIVPFGNPQSHMFEVRLNANPDVWTVGESVRLSMPTAAAKEVLAVPRDALILRREGAAVFKLGKESKVTKVNVVVGMGAGTHIEVFGDLRDGDQVVVRGAEGLSDGAEVSVVSTTAASP